MEISVQQIQSGNIKNFEQVYQQYHTRLTTTAIGTVFRITAFDGHTIRVHLLSGKVRVQHL
jgi:hypothetical protein